MFQKVERQTMCESCLTFEQRASNTHTHIGCCTFFVSRVYIYVDRDDRKEGRMRMNLI